MVEKMASSRFGLIFVVLSFYNRLSLNTYCNPYLYSVGL